VENNTIIESSLLSTQEFFSHSKINYQPDRAG